MKKLSSILIIGILVLSGLGAVGITDDVTYHLKNIEDSVVISKPIIKEAGQYVAVDLEEASSSLLNAGKPVLPVVTRVFILPFGSKISHVDVSFSETYTLALSKEVQPAPEPIPVIAGVEVAEESVKDAEIYGSSELYPASSYRCITGAGLDGEEHVIYLAVQCYPVRYSPAQNMIYYSKGADIKITYKEPEITMLSGSNAYDLVIIAPSEFSNDLQLLINHKNSYGVNTILKTTEEIYGEYTGVDEPEQIKYFIKDAIESWGIDYVLLVGNIEKLPIRTTHAGWWGEGDLLSDLYYADIYDENGSFCSWDGNNNGKFGEVQYGHHELYDIDGVDLYADVNIGRLACMNKKEVNTVVDKIIHYETYTYGESWFNNIVLCGGDTFPGRNGNEGEEKNKITEQIMSEFVPTRLWTSDNTFSPRTINRAINSGAGFVDYSGHGIAAGVLTHPPNDDSWIKYSFPHLLCLINQYKLPIIFFDACLTAKLDYSVSNLIDSLPENLKTIVKRFDFDGSKLLPCFAWCCVLKPFGGAIATIGATRVAYGGSDSGCSCLSLRFYEAYSSSETVSQMLTKAQNSYINNLWKDYFTLEEFVLLGDPSLKIGGYPSANGLKADVVDIASIESKPNKPSGPTSGKPGVEYTYTAQLTNDLSIDQICAYYYFDWGDGTFSDVLGPYPSDSPIEAIHTWSYKGSYQVRVKALIVNLEDYLFEETDWSDSISVQISVNKQLINLEPGIYVDNAQKMPFPITVFVGDTDIEVDAEGATRVEFYIDDELKAIDDDTTDNTYVWTWDEFSFGRHTLKVIAYDDAGNSDTDEMKVWKFF